MLFYTLMYRINKLLKLDQKLYHTNDLAVLWGMTNRQSLYVTISRYVKKGVLHPVHKGLYATVPIPTLDPLALGRALIHQFTYLSLEYVLAQAGVISQAVYVFTFVSGSSLRFQVADWTFHFRQMKAEHLYNPAGVKPHGGTLIASPERAAADMLYYNPHFHFDVADGLDFEQVKAIQKAAGYA